jgi:hypothetical protein
MVFRRFDRTLVASHPVVNAAIVDVLPDVAEQAIVTRKEGLGQAVETGLEFPVEAIVDVDSLNLLRPANNHV